MSNTARDGGGGIYASNAVTLTHSPVMSNTTTYVFSAGGGIWGRGAVTLTHSPVMSNKAGPGNGATGAGTGGGIAGNTVTLTDSPVMNNTAGGTGGGIYANNAVTLMHSSVMSNGPRTAGSDAFGHNGVAPRWSFPGGATRRGQRGVLLLANPSAAPVRVVATLYGSAGRTVQQHVTLPPYGQATLDVRRSFPRAAGVHGVSVTSVNGDGFLAEQTVFAASGSTVQRTQGLAQ
jgi:predicted outer membrane repeat protein